MNCPSPLKLWHFTHIDHLPSIMERGLMCDKAAQNDGFLKVEVGNLEVKKHRRLRQVDAGPGGVVADYVPFYFTSRSLMMYQIATGKVPSYRNGQSGLIYLCTTLEQVEEFGLPWVVSNRNAATKLARFTADRVALDAHVDWPLATTSTFNKLPDDLGRPQRHQAEALVHDHLPWEAIRFIGTRDDRDLAWVEQTIGTMGDQAVPRGVRPAWYF